jgi:RNA recognition motif-containing protein
VNIYVGNIPYTASDDDLRQAFSEFGTVVNASIIIDRTTGRTRGFGFVEMSTNDEGSRAIESMNGKEWMGRTLTVNEAQKRESRPTRTFSDPNRSSGGGYGGGGGGNYGGGSSRGGGGGGDRTREREKERLRKRERDEDTRGNRWDYQNDDD